MNHSTTRVIVQTLAKKYNTTFRHVYYIMVGLGIYINNRGCNEDKQKVWGNTTGKINPESEYVGIYTDNRNRTHFRINEKGVEKLERTLIDEKKNRQQPRLIMSFDEKEEKKNMPANFAIFEEMVAAAKKAEDLEKLVTDLKKQLSEKEDYIKAFTEELEEKNLKIAELTGNNAQLSAEKQKLAKDLNAYENAPLATNKYQQLMEGMGKIQADMNRIQSEFFEAEKQLATARATFNKADNDRKNTVNKLNALYKDVKSILQIIS